MTKTSPGARFLLSQPSIGVVVPSGCSTQWRPRAPGVPPCRPKAGTRRWLARVVTVIGSRKRMRLMPPSPPCQRPRPPLPGRRA
jgi:hypothetical protein